MAGPEWCRWYAGKWLNGVMTLTPEQRGVYDTLINIILDRGSCPAIEDDLIRICNCHRRKFRRIVAELIQKGKISVVNGCYTQTRAKLERKESETFSKLQQKRALKRWESNELDDASAGLCLNNHKEGFVKPESADLSTAPPTSATPAKRAPPGSRIGDWTPSEADIAEAVRIGVPSHLVMAEVFPEFRDYWVGQSGRSGVKLDWPATWRNGCRRWLNHNRYRFQAKGSTNGNGKREDWYGRRVIARAVRRAAEAEAEPCAGLDELEGRAPIWGG